MLLKEWRSKYKPAYSHIVHAASEHTVTEMT